MELGKVSRIAAIKLRGLGDTVLWAPALRALKELCPGSRLTAFCREPWQELVLGFRGVDEAVGVRARDFLGLVGALRREHPQLVVCFHATYRTALAGYLSGAAVRVVRNHSGPDYFSTLSVPAPKKAREAPLRDLEVLEALETGFDPKSHWTGARDGPPMVVPPKALEQARHESRIDKEGNWIALCPGASRQTNLWPAPRWAELAQRLREKGHNCILIVGPGEDSLAMEVMKNGGPRSVRIGGSLWVTAGILQMCRICVAADSGPKHLAAAVGCPTLTVWGSSLIHEWHPYNRKNHPLVLAPVPCRPCFQSTCDHLSCLIGIEVDDVLGALNLR